MDETLLALITDGPSNGYLRLEYLRSKNDRRMRRRWFTGKTSVEMPVSANLCTLDWGQWLVNIICLLSQDRRFQHPKKPRLHWSVIVAYPAAWASRQSSATTFNQPKPYILAENTSRTRAKKELAGQPCNNENVATDGSVLVAGTQK